MSVYSMYFSPTGGTKKVMDILAEELQVKESIDLSIPDFDYSQLCFQKEDMCLIGVPSYGGRVPGIVLERIKTMKADKVSAVIVVVYGNRAYDDTLLELRNELEKCGFIVKAAVAAVAEHSIMHQYGAGRPDKKDTEELKEFTGRIKEKLLAENIESNINLPGNHPYREYNGVPFKPKANKSCSQCGKCASGCPVQAIPKENPGFVDEGKCISCMRCVAVCPQNARKLNGVVLSVAAAKMKKACSERKKNELFM